MTAARPTAPEPPFGAAVPLDEVLADQPPVLHVDLTVDEVRAGRRLVVLDDDPTGTQTIADIPVLTSWSVEDLRWAFRQPTTAFFILTNTRSLTEADAVERNRQIVDAVHRAAELENVPYVLTAGAIRRYAVTSRSRPTCWPTSSAARGTSVDGVLICPAYIEPGRVTVQSLHWSRTGDGMVPVAHTEFAKDASFGYLSSDLRDWVEEKTAGRIAREEVATITLTDIRQGGPDRVEEILTGLSNGRPVVVDAADYADLQVVVAALLRAELAGKTFLYRTGPSFVRSRAGQQATPAIDARRLTQILAAAPPAEDEVRPDTEHGLIAVGSHVGLTTRQLEQLSAPRPDHRARARRADPARRQRSGRPRQRGRRRGGAAPAHEPDGQRRRDPD